MNNSAAHAHSRKLDQYYTDPAYAKTFFKKIEEIVDLNAADILLEPSAGSGSFYKIMNPNKRIGLDLEPKGPGILKTDFFDWTAPLDKKIITIGNPPFGKNSSLAVKFFNHAAKFSDVIAFILPRTFRKPSIINRLDKNFHLLYDDIVPDNSFIFNNKLYNVWCCAQIWIKKSTKRETFSILNFNDVKSWFEIVEPQQADFAIQRVGGRAGLIRTSNFKNYSPQSHYFIKQYDNRVLSIFQSINFDHVKFNTAGNPSISPSELINLWKDHAKLIDPSFA